MSARTIRCPKCKEFYELVIWSPPPVCDNCVKERESMLNELRETIKNNKGLNAIDLEKRTGIPLKIIMKALENGAIELIK